MACDGGLSSATLGREPAREHDNAHPSEVRRCDDGRIPFLKTCAPNARIVIGDARLTLAREPDKFSLLVVDAFSSDAIPVHLMTKEALAVYFGRLDAHGAALFNITNRHLDLARILARAGAELGLTAWLKRETEEEPVSRRLRSPTVALVLAREEADIGRLALDPGWVRVAPDFDRRPWTDDFSNLLQAMADKLRP